MRALTALFLVLFFSGSSAFGEPCSSLCADEVKKGDFHDCCREQKDGFESEVPSNGCYHGRCHVLTPFQEVPVLTIDQQTTQKKQLSFGLVSKRATRLSLAFLFSEALIFKSLDEGPAAPKVPLYIFFKKLLLPFYS